MSEDQQMKTRGAVIMSAPPVTGVIEQFASDPMGPPAPSALETATPTFTSDEILQAVGSNTPNATWSTFYTGEKFSGGFGLTSIFTKDYVLLRQRSNQVFTENLYAAGLIKRLVTNEINIGLGLESTPNTDILKLGDEFFTTWTESTESRWQMWADNSRMCDYKGALTFGELQSQVRREALISGDILVVLRQSPATNLPQIELISADSVVTPMAQAVRKGHEIRHGVEIDKRGRQVAYWVRQKDGTGKRIAAFSERRGRRMAWLVYGSPKRLEEVRGEPLLSIVLQSLKDIDRYRDAELRAAVVNSVLAMFIQKNEDKMGSLPVTGGAVRRDQATLSNPDGSSREFNIANYVPGAVMEELQTGEEPKSFDTSRPNVNFGNFEAVIVYAMSWSHEMPPEILTLSFKNNYSASRGAVVEFKMYLDKARGEFSNAFPKPIYTEWLISETLIGGVNAPGLLDAWRNPRKYAEFGAWVSSDWSGAIKPNIDPKKEADAQAKMVSEGFTTRERATKELTGTKFVNNVRKLQKENEQLAAAWRPLLELAQEFKLPVPDLLGGALTASDNSAAIQATAELVIDASEEEV